MIRPVVDELVAAMEDFPELRAGQILVNAVSRNVPPFAEMGDGERMFYVTDESFARAISEFRKDYAEGRATPPFDPNP